MIEIFKQYLDSLINLKIYPFSSLEVNFIINFIWVFLKNLFKTNSDYRYGKEQSVFVQSKLLIFMFSFLIMFLISISLDFWSIYLDLETKYILWWLPSVLAIILAEFAGILAKILKKDSVGEEEFIYFLTSFLSLSVFWLIMVFKFL